MASSEISPKAVVNALQNLNDEQSKELFFQLEVPLHVLDRIATDQKGNLRKIYFVQAWFDNEARASWNKLIAGLKQIGMNALAEALASEHYLGRSSISVASTPDPSSPAVGESRGNIADHALDLVTHASSPTSPSDRVSHVKAGIERLSDSFSDLMSSTRDDMCTRHDVDPSFLNKFRDRLLDLPVARKAPHAKFFRDSEDDFLMAKDMHKMFAILKRHCNYRNHEVLKEVVRKFGEPAIKRRMEDYCEALEAFENETTIDVYLLAISAGATLSTEFAKMTMKINKKTSECTLHEVRKLKEDITEKASLHSYSMYIGDIAESSVQLVLEFPACCAGWVLGALTPDFLTSRLLSDVVVGQKQLSSLNMPQWKLNEELIRASRDGDVMAIASLLNSGADAQSTNKGEEATPLYNASVLGHLQVVRLLTSRGAELDCRNENGWTPLMSSAWMGECDVVEELISLGASIDISDNKGDSAVITAVTGRCVDTLRLLVKSGSDLNLQNNDGLTALMIATRSGRTDITNIILHEGKGVYLDLQEKVGRWSALHFSAERGDSTTTYTLIKAGANVQLKDKNGWTALEIAEVKSADSDAAVIPKWSGYYMQYYEGVTDYAIVTELLRGNLIEPVPPPSRPVKDVSTSSKSDQSEVRREEREVMARKLDILRLERQSSSKERDRDSRRFRQSTPRNM